LTPRSSELPTIAAWRHVDARDGFEVVFLRRARDGYEVSGHSVAVEGGVAWSVRYAITLDSGWMTRSARVSGSSGGGVHEVLVEGDGSGSWLIDGVESPQLGGCLDIDLEASAFTNAFPVNRLRLDVGGSADAPAVYVRAAGLDVERLEQRYSRLPDDAGQHRYDYVSRAFDFRAVLVYDRFGLPLEYPGIAVRVL
jgi:uncharacterized protein